MPIPEDVARRLEAEALEAGRSPYEFAKPRIDGTDPTDRLRAASAVLGSTLDTLEKSIVASRSAMTMFLMEWEAALKTGVNPAARTVSREVADRVMQATRPKTFGQQRDQQETTHDRESREG
jgi:hypothetical protein